MSSLLLTLNPKTITKSGWLEKMGGSVQSWKNRFFALHDKGLSYFKDDQMKEVLGLIPIVDAVVTTAPATGGPGFYFTVQIPPGTGKRTDFLIRTNTEEDRIGWMSEIAKATRVTVFGGSLANAVRANPSRPGTYVPVPYFLVRAVQYIREQCLDMEGIYRINGSTMKIESYVKQIDVNYFCSFDDGFATTGLMKQFLRNMPEPVFGVENFPALEKIIQLPVEQQIEPMIQIVRRLPILNYVMLAFLFEHLCEIHAHEKTNQMNTRTIGVCVGPGLVWSRASVINEPEVQIGTCICLLNNYEQIFGATPLLRYQTAVASSFRKLIQEQDSDYPFTLTVPVGSIVQVVAEDSTGWTVCVSNDHWGVVHDKALGKVETDELRSGLGRQSSKWTLDDKEITRIGGICPEALELYNGLRTKLNELRDKAHKQSP